MRRTLREDQFSAFAQAAWALLYRSAFLLIGDHGRAEDLVQSALAKTYVHWRQLRSPDAAFGYTRAVLLNEARSIWRAASWAREQPTAELPDGADTADPSLRPALLEALRTLPPRQRAVVVLRFYDDLSVGQAADVLGCSTGTVKSQTSDALTKLRLLLGDRTLEGLSHD